VLRNGQKQELDIDIDIDFYITSPYTRAASNINALCNGNPLGARRYCEHQVVRQPV
jgi:hypothetical protein